MFALAGLYNLNSIRHASNTGLWLGKGSTIRRESEPERFEHTLKFNKLLSWALFVIAVLMPFSTR